jgi:predicted aspartyl protease
VIHGHVTLSGVVLVMLEVGGREWPAILDTGFNGDLELPFALGAAVDPQFEGMVESQLADGSVVEEESYSVLLPFDGSLVEASATFRQCDEILIGTRLLRNHRVEIDFPAGTVVLERSTWATTGG